MGFNLCKSVKKEEIDKAILYCCFTIRSLHITAKYRPSKACAIHLATNTMAKYSAVHYLTMEKLALVVLYDWVILR